MMMVHGVGMRHAGCVGTVVARPASTGPGNTAAMVAWAAAAVAGLAATTLAYGLRLPRQQLCRVLPLSQPLAARCHCRRRLGWHGGLGCM